MSDVIIELIVPVFLLYIIHTRSRGYVRCVWSRNVSDTLWCPRQQFHEIKNAFRYHCDICKLFNKLL